MTDSNLKAEKSRNLDPARLLASPRLAQWVLIVLAVLILLVLLPLVVGGPGAGEAAQRFAADSLQFLVLYLILAGSLLVCMVRRLKGVARRVGIAPAPRLRVGSQTVVVSSEFDVTHAARVLKWAGYGHIATNDGWVWGVKHRWSPLGTLVLHSAVLLALVGAALAVIPGVDQMAHVSALPGQTVRLSPDAPELRLASLDARRSKEGTLIGLSAVMRTLGGKYYLLHRDLPVLVSPVTAVIAEDYDVAPSFSIQPTGSPSPVYRRTAALRLRRGAERDRMIVDAGRLGTYRITVRLDPTDSDNVIATTERRVERGMWKLIDSERTFRPGDVVRVGAVRLVFDGLQPYAILRVHSAPSGPIITIALLAAMFGTSLRLLFPRAEATIAQLGSSTSATVVVDAYKGSRSASAALAIAFEEIR